MSGASQEAAAPSEEPVAWCQPMDCGKHTPRKFIVRFEDADKGDAIFDDEAEARDYWERANGNWNCYLFGALPRVASPAVAPVAVSVKPPLVTEEWAMRMAEREGDTDATTGRRFPGTTHLSPAQIAEMQRLALEDLPAWARNEITRLRALSSIIPATKGGEDELHAISAAIGSVRFMDPPDGGDVSLSEQVSRMRQALKIAEAGVQAARPIIEALIAQEYNVETWGLRSLLAALSAQDTDGVAK